MSEKIKKPKQSKENKKPTLINTLLIMLLAFQICWNISLLVNLNHCEKPNPCANSFTCNCNEENCECYYCEEGGFECENPAKINCPSQN